MTLKFKLLLFTSLFIGSFGALEANEYCQCLKVITFNKLNNKFQYIAQCYVNGKPAQLVESTTVNSAEEAQKKTTATLKTLGINPGDCIEYPDGSMVLLPKRKEN